MSLEQTLTPPAGATLRTHPASAPERDAADAGAGLRAEEFEQLVAEHQRRIYRVMLAVTRDADAADTLTQECFLRAYQKRAGYRGEASIGTWLVRIAVNLARDHGRSRRRAFWAWLTGNAGRNHGGAQAVVFEVADPGASPERLAAARQELASVWAAADELAPQQRTVFLLRFAEEMTLEEIAETMEVEVGTVKAHLFRAVGAIRRRFRHSGAGKEGRQK
jgi:RNA polymerase sigma-70 factor (ECF subfamily)